MKYRTMKPVGKCKICGINLWAEHENMPAPHTYPCKIANCPHPKKADVVMLPFTKRKRIKALPSS